MTVLRVFMFLRHFYLGRLTKSQGITNHSSQNLAITILEMGHISPPVSAAVTSVDDLLKIDRNPEHQRPTCHNGDNYL